MAVVFTVGGILFGYGVGVTLRLLPSGWGIVAVFQGILMVLGALFLSVVALLTLWFWRQEHPHPLTKRQIVTISLLAPLLSAGATVVTYWLKVGELSLPQFLGWTMLGLAVVSLQFVLGTVTPGRRRRLLLLAEPIVIFVVLFGFLTIDRQQVDLVSYTVVSGGAGILLLVFGGPLYLLGNQVSGVSR